MSLTLGHPIAYLLLAVLASIVLTWWLYRETTPELSRNQRLLLGFLRSAALSIILFLLAEPLFLNTSQITEQPVLGLLFDESQSMELSEADSTRDNRGYRELIDRILSATSSERVSLFGFGGEGRELPIIDSLSLDAPRTNVSAGLEFVRDRLQDKLLGAVVLVSDGRHIEGRNPEHVADLFPVPVITLVVGDTTIRKDLRIQQVLSNELSYVGREVPVQVHIRNEGHDAQFITVTMTMEGRILDQEMLTLPPSGGVAITELTFVPDKVGFFQYRIDISHLDGELTFRNNSQLLSLQILERERQVLLLSGAPSPDASAYARMLSENSDTQLTVRTQKAPGVYYEGSLAPLDMAPDLIILNGYPSNETTAGDISLIRAAIESGSSLLYVMDRSSDLVSLKGSLARFLPVRPRIIRSGFVTGFFVPADRAHLHAVFDISNRRETSSWSRLPPISLNQTTWDLVPGAVTLAHTTIRGISVENPVFIINRSLGSRSAAFLASGLWRWRNAPEDLDAEAGRWTELFTNLVQWLVTGEDDRPVRVSPSRGALDESEPVDFGGQVYDENLAPVSDASVLLTIEAPDGELFPYQMQVLGNGRYTIKLGNLSEGTYSYTAVATRDGGELGSDRGTFSVGALSVEFRTPYADPLLMRQIARRSGGFSISADNLDGLSARLAALPSFKPRTVTTESQMRLWRRLPFLLVVLVLMSVEWFMRKRFGLV